MTPEAGTPTPERFIARLRLAQFRSYALAEIETGGASVALFGANGAGKTNLLEALSLLVPGRGLRRAASEDLARRPGEAGWRLRAQIARTGTEPLEIVTGAEPRAPGRRVEIDTAPEPQTRLGEHLAMVWLTPAMDRLFIEGASERRRFLDRVALGFTPGHAQTAIDYEKAMRARNRLLREGGSDPAWLSALEAQMARLGVALARARTTALMRLSAAQLQAGAFPAADLTIDGPLERAFAAAPEDTHDTLAARETEALTATLAEARRRDAAAGRTLTGPHLSDLDAVYTEKALPARVCSTGEQKALLLSMCLANARALAAATGRAPVLLLDEIAAHLDSERRRALYTEIAALGAQAFMTGTGAALFEGAEALCVGVDDSGQGSALAIVKGP
ncbi:MAG: DNA replication/repair protein RecF [Pseudomonadota bacterium]